jgi:ATPase subunit of ABC transporter with duplicated ATPase domains
VAIYVLTTDPRTIDFGHADLVARVESYLAKPVALYRPLSFVEHSGFSETVREEIALVLANHPPGEPPIRAFDDFVSAWDLSAHLGGRVLALSGGWRKYLGLALFMNRPLKTRLLLDTTSHLSDARIRTVLERAAESGDAVFCEYDPQLLQRLDPRLVRLTDDGSSVLGGVPG